MVPGKKYLGLGSGFLIVFYLLFLNLKVEKEPEANR